MARSNRYFGSCRLLPLLGQEGKSDFVKKVVFGEEKPLVVEYGEKEFTNGDKVLKLRLSPLEQEKLKEIEKEDLHDESTNDILIARIYGFKSMWSGWEHIHG